MNQLLYIFSILPLSLYVGALFAFSFIFAPQLFRELPREMAGDFVSKLLPRYFMTAYGMLGLSLASQIVSGWWQKTFRWELIIILVLMLLGNFYTATQIHPKTHTLRTVLRTMEDGSEKEIKQKEFSRLHQASVIFHLAILILGCVAIILNKALRSPTT